MKFEVVIVQENIKHLPKIYVNDVFNTSRQFLYI